MPLCPKCHVRVEKDDLGELLCPKCGIRVCPKAHEVEGRICPSCGWVDPNYYLWQKKQKARTRASPSVESEQPPKKKLCPICGTTNDASAKYCRNRSCNWDFGSRPQTIQQPPVVTTAAQPPTKSPPAPIQYRPAQPHIAAPSSPLLQEIRKAGRREWDLTFVRRLLQPIGASLLVAAVLLGIGLGIFILFTETIIPSSSRPTGTASPEISVPWVSSSAKAYTLSINVAPRAGGHVQISTPHSSQTDSQITEIFKPGTEIVLTAQPSDCYTFDRWEIGDALRREKTTTISMDSDKSVTLFFKPADTTPPSILEVDVSRLSDISATIILTTDEPSSVTVEYGETEALGRTSKSEEPTSSNNDQFKYSILLTGLKSNTTYHYRVQSQDACGNVAISDIKTLTTTLPIPVGHKLGNRAPDFSLQTVDGKVLSLSDLLGKKLLLNFWSTYCGPCARELPYFQEVYRDYCEENCAASDSALVTICLDRGEAVLERINKLEDKYGSECGGFTFPILLDKERSAKDAYHVTRVPTTFLINTTGIITEIKVGRFKSAEEIEKAFESLK